MRRILAGIVSGGLGLVVYSYFQSRPGMLLASAVTMGTYAAIDQLGLLPPPFEEGVRSILHDKDDQEQG